MKRTSLADGMWKNMEKRVEKKIISTFVLLMIVATCFVSFTEDLPRPYIAKADWETSSESATAYHNDTWLNVTIESKYPRILWYDIQKYTGAKTENDTQVPATAVDSDWISIRNNMTEVDNATWLRVVINISSDQGWENIDYINISGWHDNGTLESGTGYNDTDNHGSNRNFFLSYNNTTGTPDYNIFWPRNQTELTKGNFTEDNVTDALGIDGETETHNLTFEFKPGYQFRYAPGPDGTGLGWENHSVNNTNGFPNSDPGIIDYQTSSWEALNNSWSWNLNISVSNQGMRGGDGDATYSEDNYTSWVLDEFGVYSYTEIVSADSASIMGAPGGNYSTNASNPFHDVSQNVSLKTRSNGNYSLLVNLSDLKHSAYDDVSDQDVKDNLTLNNDCIWVRGGTRTTRKNFSDSGVTYIDLYGELTAWDTGTSGINNYEHAEVNGTCKLTGEVSESGDDNSGTPRFPNYYSSYTEYDSQNENSTYIEFTCDIPNGKWAGKYSTNVYYTLVTETMS